MTAGPLSDTAPPALARDLPCDRRCLRCAAVFPSDGFGERICRACKATVVWRTAPAARTDGSRQRGARQSGP